MTVYALCSKMPSEYLTEGKRYAVLKEWDDVDGEWFQFINDEGGEMECRWVHSCDGVWERIEENEMTEAPQWALDEAARRGSHYADYCEFLKLKGPHHVLARAIKAHALTIAKHETPPVDRDLEKARELVKEYFDWGNDRTRAEDARQAVLAGIKWARQEANNGTS